MTWETNPARLWLEANGVNPDDLAPTPITVAGDLIVFFVCSWPGPDGSSEVHTWGDEVIFRQVTAPLLVPPPPGLLQQVAQGARREQLRRIIGDVLTAWDQPS